MIENKVVADMGREEKLETFRASYEALMQFGARYRADEAFRARIENGDYEGIHEAFRGVFRHSAGIALPEGAEIRVVPQTPDVFYIPLPEDPCKMMSDEELKLICGGVGTWASAQDISYSVMTSNCQAGTMSSQSSVGPGHFGGSG